MIMLRVLIGWVLSAVVFLGLSKLLPGFYIRSFGMALVVSAVYGVLHIILHFMLFRVLWILTIPFVVLTLGLIYFVVNAVILWLTDKLVEDFHISTTATLVLAAILLTIANSIIRFALFL
jgi:putative membrane protein